MSKKRPHSEDSSSEDGKSPGHPPAKRRMTRSSAAKRSVAAKKPKPAVESDLSDNLSDDSEFKADSVAPSESDNGDSDSDFVKEEPKKTPSSRASSARNRKTPRKSAPKTKNMEQRPMSRKVSKKQVEAAIDPNKNDITNDSDELSELDDDYIAESSDEESEESAEEENPENEESTEAQVNRNDTQVHQRRRQIHQQNRKLREKEQILHHHPELADVWTKLDEQIADFKEEMKMVSCVQPEALKVRLLPYQTEGLAWLLKQENTDMKGGILADEMGMGKTLSMISLILSAPLETPTLVLAPTVAISQWRAEVLNRINESSALNVLIFHGQNRISVASELMKYDVIITSYAVVESGFRKQEYGVKRKGEKVYEKSILHSIDWGRIILDEAHSIKDRTCNTARAVFHLKADFKWSLSGTPLQNRVGELYSLIRFLNADPFSFYFCKKCPCKTQTWKFSNRRTCDECGHKPMQHFCWWNSEILKPIQNHGAQGEGLEGFEKLGKLLTRIMLRRTKIEKADDLGLPPRNFVIRRDYFSDEEKDFYQSLYSDSKRQFATYIAEGTVLNHYANIFELLTKMRQAANHPDMVTTKLKSVQEMNGEHLVCGICNEPCEDAIMSKCKHTFCREDITQYIQSSLSASEPSCPVCFTKLSIDLTQPEIVPPSSSDAPSVLPKSIVNRIDMSKWRSSTKIEALVEELTSLRNQNHTIKSIVFSQFVSFLDLAHWRLRKAGFECVKLDGRMNLQQRDAVIKAFNENPDVTVFLISLKAGGVALNLTEASQVFCCDSWWNPAAEDQAFDRIHRLGQRRPIRITKLLIQDSIEERIVQLQEKKKALFDSTIGKDVAALAKLSEEDLRFLFVM
ncbi:SNF2 family N-terminal domain-containing protein [Paraphysoderma sedebokerense]|nr:SNF2 family N-terminal domain-containing protein [Paraphysoderma sedebokerense]